MGPTVDSIAGNPTIASAGRGGRGGGGGAGGRGGRGGGGGGPQPGWSTRPVDTGYYLATVVVGNQTSKQLARVENIGLADPTKAIGYEAGMIVR
jgi:hypothetical protein